MADTFRRVCKRCEHYRPFDATEGECHRYPPTLLNIEENEGFGLFPKVFANCSCGEFKRDDDLKEGETKR